MGRTCLIAVAMATLVAVPMLACAATSDVSEPRCTEGDSDGVPLSLFAPLTTMRVGQEIQLTLPVFGGHVLVKLTRDTERVQWPASLSARASNKTRASKRETTRTFTGSAVGIDGSSVWLTLPHGDELAAVLGGVMLPAQSTTLSLQPGGHFVPSVPHSSAVVSGLVKVTCHTVVADDKALRFHSNTDDDDANNGHEHSDEPKRAEHPPDHPHRGRRGSPLSASHIACPVFVDVDASFHEHWGGSGTDTQRMEQTAGVVAGIMGQVSDLYEAQMHITLPLAGVHIRTDAVSPVPSTGGSELSGYETWLTGGSASTTRSAAAAAMPRGQDTPTASESCLNILLVYVPPPRHHSH